MPVVLPRDRLWFPPASAATKDGLLAVGGDLSPQRLLLAYARGIFPWYSEGAPILWWSPDPRCVLPLDGLHVPRRLTRRLRRGEFHLTVDAAFEQVMECCAQQPRPGQDGTWILPEMREAYGQLHAMGFAHSVEAWKDGRLVGGIYGVALGRAFFGESMFHLEADASKVALVGLVDILRKENVTLFDCQQETPHMRRWGAVVIPREEFLRRLDGALAPVAYCSSCISGSWASRS